MGQGRVDGGPVFPFPLDLWSCRFDFEEIEALVGFKPGLLVDVKYNAAAEIGLDRRLLRAMRSASNLKEKVTEVFELLRDPVYQYLVTLLANQEEAEDLTQEVFLRLYHCLHKGQAVNNVRAWVFWVAHNLALNQRRNDSKIEPVDTGTWDRLCERQLDSAPDAEQRVLER